VLQHNLVGMVITPYDITSGIDHSRLNLFGLLAITYYVVHRSINIVLGVLRKSTNIIRRESKVQINSIEFNYDLFTYDIITNKHMIFCLII
jgi:hypothetical protein